MLKGKRILITAGPTMEFIDPVRFISNASSGKMGYALAEELYREGADVILVTGPTSINSALPKGSVHQVSTALEMLEVCKTHFQHIDVAIFAAAVADYRPITAEQSKIKKTGDLMTIEFIKNPDIAFEFGKVKTINQISIGFALETDNLRENGEGKLKKKNFDFIVLNTTNERGEGFGHDTNKISLLSKDLSIKNFELKSKTEVAKDIITELREIVSAYSLM